MSAVLDAYILRQRQALVGEVGVMGQVPPIVAVLGLGTLIDFWSRRLPAATFAPLRGTSNLIVQRGPTGNWLWIDPAYDGYRAAFGTFLETVQGVTAGLSSSYHVDHVYNRARARQFGYGLVRMALVSGPVNTDHGRNYEKGIGAADRPRRAKIMKLLDAMTELKVFGIQSLRAGASLSDEQLAAAEDAAATYGISAQQARDGIVNMRDRAGR